MKTRKSPEIILRAVSKHRRVQWAASLATLLQRFRYSCFSTARLLLFSILGVSLVLAPLSLAAQKTYSRIYNSDQLSRIYASLETQSGDLALAGIIADKDKQGRGLDVWLMIADREGNPRWTRRLKLEGHQVVRDMIETRDGNLTLLASGRDPRTGHMQALVMQLTPYGELLWFRRYGGETGDDLLHSLTQAQDGGFILCGSTEAYSDSTDNIDLWLVRLDAAGRERWQRNLGGRDPERGYVVREATDGRILIGGAVRTESVNGMDVLALCTDRKGRPQWKIHLPARGDGMIADLQPTSDGGWLMVGEAEALDDPLNLSDAHVWRVSSQGDLLWTRNFRAAGLDRFLRIVPDGEQGWSVLGQTSYLVREPAKSSAIWLMGIDDAGNKTWEQVTRGEQPEDGFDLYPLREGGYLVGGGTQAADRNHAVGYLLRTDAKGRFGPAASGVFLETDIQDMPPTAPPDAKAGKPRLLVLAVGISTFADPNWNLRFAAQDAQTLAESLSVGSVETLYQGVVVRSLVDSAATRTRIEAGLEWLASQATSQDIILMYFSSHGLLDASGQMHLLAHDFDSEKWPQTSLDMYSLQTALGAIAGKKIIMLDACHSGQSGSNLLLQSATATQLNQSAASGLSLDPNLTLLTAANGDEYAYEDIGWGQSAFAKATLEALEGTADFNGDGILTLYELNFYLSQRVRDLTLDQQHPSMPINLFGDIPLFPIQP